MANADSQDALIYSSIQNVLSSTSFPNKNADYWTFNTTTKLFNSIPSANAFGNFLGKIGAGGPSGLSELVSNSTFKRACCLANETTTGSGLYQVDVKLPYVDSIVQAKITDGTITSDKAALWKKLGFMTKTITVPKSSCIAQEILAPADTDISIGKCDNVYRAYCENAKQMYTTDVSGAYVESEYVQAYPDCACYIDRPYTYPTGVQAACYAQGCYAQGGTVFVENGSRNNPCKITNCTNVTSIGKINAESGAAIQMGSPNVNITCGQVAAETTENPVVPDGTSGVTDGTSGAPTSPGAPRAPGAPTSPGASRSPGAPGAPGAPPTSPGAPGAPPTSPGASSSSSSSTTTYIIIGVVVLIVIIAIIVFIMMSKKKTKKSSSRIDSD